MVGNSRAPSAAVFREAESCGLLEKEIVYCGGFGHRPGELTFTGSAFVNLPSSAIVRVLTRCYFPRSTERTVRMSVSPRQSG